MSHKKHKAEEIVAKLRQVDVLVSQGRSVSKAVRAKRLSAMAAQRISAAPRIVERPAPSFERGADMTTRTPKLRFSRSYNVSDRSAAHSCHWFIPSSPMIRIFAETSLKNFTIFVAATTWPVSV